MLLQGPVLRHGGADSCVRIRLLTTVPLPCTGVYLYLIWTILTDDLEFWTSPAECRFGVKLVVFCTGGKPIYTGDSGRFRVLSFKCGQVGAATTHLEGSGREGGGQLTGTAVTRRMPPKKKVCLDGKQQKRAVL